MEEIGLIIFFEEVRKRGENNFSCVVRAIEEGVGEVEVQETIVFDSWSECKEKFPTLKDILIDLFPTSNWNPEWRGGDRLIFIENISGHEGLYDFNEEERVEVDWDEIN